MSTLWQNPIVVVVMLAWLAAPSRSLSDVSQREAVRRRMTTKSSVVLSNIGQPLEIPLVGASTPPAQTAASAGAAAATPAGATAAKPEAKKDEAYWKARMTEARQAVDRNQAEAERLQSRINVLQRDVVNEDNPMKQGQHREALQLAMKQLEQTKAQVESGRQAVEAVQEEARRASVPAGWVR